MSHLFPDGIRLKEKMQILYLFLFYGTLRASTLLPTLIAIGTHRTGDRGMFWGILVAFIVGLPVFAIGNFTSQPGLALGGSILTVLSAGIIALLGSTPGSKKQSGPSS